MPTAARRSMPRLAMSRSWVMRSCARAYMDVELRGRGAAGGMEEGGDIHQNTRTL